jgi:hypothetical protein
MTIQFFSADKPSSSRNRVPKWKRSFGVHSVSGDILIPAVFIDDEQIVMMSAMYDGGVLMTHYLNHLYVSIDWLISEYPKSSSKLTTMKSQIQSLLISERVFKLQLEGS